MERVEEVERGEKVKKEGQKYKIVKQLIQRKIELPSPTKKEISQFKEDGKNKGKVIKILISDELEKLMRESLEVDEWVVDSSVIGDINLLSLSSLSLQPSHYLIFVNCKGRCFYL